MVTYKAQMGPFLTLSVIWSFRFIRNVCFRSERWGIIKRSSCLGGLAVFWYSGPYLIEFMFIVPAVYLADLRPENAFKWILYAKLLNYGLIIRFPMGLLRYNDVKVTVVRIVVSYHIWYFPSMLNLGVLKSQSINFLKVFRSWGVRSELC